MKEDKIILPSAALVSLYKDTLVLPEKEIITPEKEEKALNTLIGQDAIANTTAHEKLNEEKAVTPAAPLKFLGDHLKKITIVVQDPEAVHLNEADLGLLSSILNACKLTLADIALINIAKQPCSLQDILETLPSVLVIAFEVNSSQLKIKLPATLYQPMVLGETHLLFSSSLGSMQPTEPNAKIEKSKLWNVLKILFKL